MQCPACYADIDNPDARFCHECGHVLAEHHHCSECDRQLKSSDKYCDQCGAHVDFTSAGGTAAKQGEEHFKCSACEILYPLAQQFEDKQVCQSCANLSGMAQLPGKGQAHHSAPEADLNANENEGRAKSDEQLNIAHKQQCSVAESRQRDIEEAELKANEETERKLREQARQHRIEQLNLGISDADWVLIPAGEFIMGSPEHEEKRHDNERLHRVELSSFRMLKTPVTFAMYDSFCRVAGREKPIDEGWGRSDRPVINITFWDAVDYCKWLARVTGWSVHLPKETEWEYACRAGTRTTFWNGNSINTDQANYDGHYTYGRCGKGLNRKKTTPAGSFQPNPWGLFDMHGNVWEWCASEYDPDYHGNELRDISTDRDNKSRRVLRGGSWLHGPEFMRSANRYRYFPDSSSYGIGFRIIIRGS